MKEWKISIKRWWNRALRAKPSPTKEKLPISCRKDLCIGVCKSKSSIWCLGPLRWWCTTTLFHLHISSSVRKPNVVLLDREWHQKSQLPHLHIWTHIIKARSSPERKGRGMNKESPFFWQALYKKMRFASCLLTVTSGQLVYPSYLALGVLPCLTHSKLWTRTGACRRNKSFSSSPRLEPPSSPIARLSLPLMW